MDFHRNEGVEICLLETGAMRFAVDAESYPLGPSDLTITRPWQAHRQGDPRIAAGRLHWATIAVGAQRPDQDWRWPRWNLLAPADTAELTRRLRMTASPVWRASPEVLRSFQRMAAATEREKGDRRVSRLAVGLNELLLGVLDLLRAENRTEQPRLVSSEHSVELFLGEWRNNRYLSSRFRRRRMDVLGLESGARTTSSSCSKSKACSPPCEPDHDGAEEREDDAPLNVHIFPE